MTGDVQASVPARPEFLYVLRIIAAGVATRVDFRVDAIEDLKLIVSEASAHLLNCAPSSRTLFLRISPIPDALEVQVWIDARPEEGVSVAEAGGLSWNLLSGLAKDLVVEDVNGGIGLRFRSLAVSGESASE